MHGLKWPINSARTRISALPLSLSLPLLLLTARYRTPFAELQNQSLTQGRKESRKTTTAEGSGEDEAAGDQVTPKSGACTITRPCAQQYVGKSQSCMVTSGRLIVHAVQGGWHRDKTRAAGGIAMGPYHAVLFATTVAA